MTKQNVLSQLWFVKSKNKLYFFVHLLVQDAKLCNQKVVHYVADDAKKRVNAAFLIGAYSVCCAMSIS